jgi:hypothetical protein
MQGICWLELTILGMRDEARANRKKQIGDIEGGG